MQLVLDGIFRDMRLFLLAALLLCPMLATAQFAVTVSPPKVVGQKAIVQLKIKTNWRTRMQK